MAKRHNQKTKAERVAEAVARAVNAGAAVALDTVEFSDPNRPKTCLEVDFPILPVNQIATIEGNAGKPIYQVSKWWARRRSSVFRSLLIAAATRAPADPAAAAKTVWDAYYANHQTNGTFSGLKVADIFMGGGTTIVEGSRLGMQMYGADLNPVAWFIVRNALSDVTRTEVEALLADVEAEVRPQIMPFYACDCPRGHRGVWTRRSTGEEMGADFDPLSLTPEQRTDYDYRGPETIYVFWAKHGPCQVTGCGHRTPLMSSPVMAVKTLTVRAWPHRCARCGRKFDIEERDVRMAPGVAQIIAEGEAPSAVLARDASVRCPHCDSHESMLSLRDRRAKRKRITLSLLVSPQWLSGASSATEDGVALGGSATDTADATARWNRIRAARNALFEVRGVLPKEVTCPYSGARVRTDKGGGTVPKKSAFACGACGTVQDVLTAVKATGKTGPVAAYAMQGYCPVCDKERQAYDGRFFAPMTDTGRFDAAATEWEQRQQDDMSAWWPRSALPFGFMTHKLNGGIPNHGFTHWWTMFNARQLLVHTQLLRAIVDGSGVHRWQTREYALGAFQQYLRNQSKFTIWNIRGDKLEPMFANANYHPKSTFVENGVFAALGRGNWASCVDQAIKACEWADAPWDTVASERLRSLAPGLSDDLNGKSKKVYPDDAVRGSGCMAKLECVSATDLSSIESESCDLIVTDPPFGGLLHYSELADFFHAWLRLALQDRHPEQFSPEYTPKTLEAVSNRARHPEDPDAFYQRILTACWREGHRILRPGGTLAFTFHHSQDAPWVSVLESLFEAGFYLEATYPIRGDETKGQGEFGSRQIEYDIIHVCRKRREAPQPVSWARMRRQVLADVRRLHTLLEHHEREGLSQADLQVIRRGKALEYFSRHYGQVYVDEDRAMSVEDALIGINQLLDEDLGVVPDPPPANAEPFTRQFLRVFDGRTTIPRDQVQKHLRGTGMAPQDFENRGWCRVEKKTYYLTPPLEIARVWAGERPRGRPSDYDQAALLVGACFDHSGINAVDTLNSGVFSPHPALDDLLDWFSRRGGSGEIQSAAGRARRILHDWRIRHPGRVQRQMDLFLDGDETAQPT